MPANANAATRPLPLFLEPHRTLDFRELLSVEASHENVAHQPGLVARYRARQRRRR